MKTSYEVRAAIIAYLKSQSTVTSLLTTNGQIKELQWQGDEFIYPAVRVGVDLFPNVADNCPDRVEITIDSYSEEKSSSQSIQLSDAIAAVFHKKPFDQNGLNFSSVVVTSILKPTRNMFAWQSPVAFRADVS